MSTRIDGQQAEGMLLITELGLIIGERMGKGCTTYCVPPFSFQVTVCLPPFQRPEYYRKAN